ncbi:hypothetical protein [Polyangium jinanense]|uniref:Secreted protein n=1 Tax=Polyangium jinanense TaxID=2829994 RepID=A0A9X3X2A7_9BACT|nr:hypothetical protein [Polyangium jinanense]MDC3955189.1 hypothetical protein [Polyangium jinanense]MDC3981490.1 hypothetical protein [Polyangium jinanense]
MTLRTTFLGLTLSAMLPTAASAAPPQPCTPARLGANVSAQPEAWRRAVEDLVAATGTAGQPWSCVGGEVDLVVSTDVAQVTVVDADGHTVTREVESPDEVGPLGEALLAKPLPPSPETPSTPQKDPQPREPRVLLGIAVGPRYAGPAHRIWGGVTLSAAVPFRSWGGGVWIRQDGFSMSFVEGLPQTAELCIGASAFRSFTVGSIELRPALRPSLAVVSSVVPEEELEGDKKFDQDTRLYFRLGLETQVVVPISGAFRAVIAVDGEVAPSGRAWASVPFPGYTLGLGVGLEVAIP